MKLMKHKKIFKKRRFNPHSLWTAFCVSFVLILIVELCAFSWYFLNISQTLDTPAQADLETNAQDIKKMTKELDKVEATLKARVGAEIEPSQNSPVVVE